MELLTKVWTALRGIKSEEDSQFLDKQGINILEQEIQKAKIVQNNAKQSLTTVMVEQLKIERQVHAIHQQQIEYDQSIRQLIEQDNDISALKIAQKIANIEMKLDTVDIVLTHYNEQVADLKMMILNVEQQINTLNQEIILIKSTEIVHHATFLTAHHFSKNQSSLHSVNESLTEIKKRQQRRQDKMLSARELAKEHNEMDLQEKLIKAGVIPHKIQGQSVLTRYQFKENI
jgi:phage shock protein A